LATVDHEFKNKTRKQPNSAHASANSLPTIGFSQPMVGWYKQTCININPINLVILFVDT